MDSNIDRLFAIWQAIHPRTEPNHWFKNEADGQKDLKPFRRNKAGDYWKSDDVYDTTKLGYTYPDLLKIHPSGGHGDPLRDLIEGVNKLYGATRRAAQKAIVTGVRFDTLSLEEAVKAGPLPKVQAQVPHATLAEADKPCIKSDDYIVNIKYER